MCMTKSHSILGLFAKVRIQRPSTSGDSLIWENTGIHPLIDIRLWEKTEGDKDISFPKNLLAFAESQKQDKANSFDVERDKSSSDDYGKENDSQTIVAEKIEQ